MCCIEGIASVVERVEIAVIQASAVELATSGEGRDEGWQRITGAGATGKSAGL